MKLFQLTGRTLFYLKNWGQLTTDPSVLDIIKGYRLRFKGHPHQFYRPITNPKSSKEFQAIKQEVNSLLSKGAIKQIPKSQAKFVSRLFTVPKKSVINLKPLNQFLHLQTFKMEGLPDLKVLLEPNDFMITIDLSDAYMTLPIEEESRNYLCFQFQDQMFQFCVLPFGLNDAPRAFTKTLKPPVGTLRSLGFKLVVYLDDIILAASTRDLCIYQGQILIKTLENLGFVINLEKSNLVPSQVVLFLGFVVDSKKMSFSLPDSKIQSIRLSAQTLLNQPKVSLRKLSQFIGMCNASRTAVLEAPLHYRSIQNQLTSTLRSQPITQQNYDVKICLNSHSREDLTWWVKNLKTNCSRPIHPPPVDLSIMSDASDLAWGAHLESVRIQGFWRSYQFSWLINRKELKAAFLALKFLIPNRTNVHAQICIDNRTAVAYINHLGGTRSLELNSIAVKMWAWCLERNMFLSALYVPGILNKIADLLSRLKLESTEWMLNPRIFKQIANVYRMPVLDMFASALNHQVPKYFSWTLDPQAVGMDAFSVHWNKGLLYMFPPFSLIQKCLRKIIEDKATVLLITPVWQSRPWYPMLLNLLYDRPLLLPHNPQILKLPWSQTVHPLFQNRKFRLAVWPLSGDLLKTKNFQKGCAKYCRPHGNLVQKNNIKVLGNNSLAGVHKDRVIRFLAL